MRKRKTLTYALILTVAVFMFSSCATFKHHPTSSPESHNTNLIVLTIDKDFEVNNITDKWDFNGEFKPGVSYLRNNSSILIDGGSSSCPNSIETLHIEDEKITINYSQLEPGRVCTMDYRMTAMQLTLNAPIYNLKDKSFFLKVSSENDTRKLPLNIINQEK